MIMKKDYKSVIKIMNKFAEHTNSVIDKQNAEIEADKKWFNKLQRVKKIKTKQRTESQKKDWDILKRCTTDHFHKNEQIKNTLTEMDSLKKSLRIFMVKGFFEVLIIIYLTGKINYHLGKGRKYFVVPSTYHIAAVVGCTQQHVQQTLEKYGPLLGLKKINRDEINEPRYTKFRTAVWIVHNLITSLQTTESRTALNMFFYRTLKFKNINKENQKALSKQKKQNNQIINEVGCVTETDEWFSINWSMC